MEREIEATFVDTVVGNEPRTEGELEDLRSRLLMAKILRNQTIMKALGRKNPDELFKFVRRPSGESRLGKPASILGKYHSFGSGFLISSDGWLITNQHVVGESETVDIRMTDGKIHPAKVVETDEKKDLALLKIETKVSAWLPVSEGTKELSLGDSVFTIGYPNPILQGMEPKYTDGRISSQAGMMDDKNYYQISVPVQPGNSGGPLIDSKSGWVVGVVTLRLDHTSDGRPADNVSYAVKCSVLRKFIGSGSAAEKAMLATPSPKLTESAAIIDRVKGAAVEILVPEG